MPLFPMDIENCDELAEAIYDILGITEPGAIADRKPNGNLVVWATEDDYDDAAHSCATYISTSPITDAEWAEVTKLAWIWAYHEN